MSRDQAVLSRQQLAALQGQAERQTQLMEAMVSRAGAASPAPSFTGLTLHKMSVHDDPQTILEMFEATAAVCGWPGAEWAVRLLPLLSGDTQTAPSRGQYGEIKRAVLDLPPQVPGSQARARRSAICVHAAIEERGDQVAATRGLRRRGETARQDRPGAVCGGAPSSHLGPRRGPGSGPPHHTPARPSPRPRTTYFNTQPSPLPRTNPPSPFFPPQGPAATGVALDPQRVPQAAGQECWRCGQLGHFRGECPLMEVGQVIRVVGPPAPSPGPGGTYSVPVRIQVGTHQAMVDSGCMQSIVHQDLIRPGALIEAGGVDIRCVHGDIHTYPVVLVEIRFKG